MKAPGSLHAPLLVAGHLLAYAPSSVASWAKPQTRSLEGQHTGAGMAGSGLAQEATLLSGRPAQLPKTIDAEM